MSKWIVDIHGEIEGDFDLICKAGSTIPLDKVKKAREEIIKESFPESEDSFCKMVYLGDVLKILDKLIESEGK